MKKKWIVFSVVCLGCCALSYFLLAKPFWKNQVQRSQLCIQGAYFEPVEIVSFPSDIPCVDIKIGEKIITARVDLGFSGGISLTKNITNQITDKSFVQRTSSLGLRGKRYYNDVYKIPKTKIGNIVLFEATAEEDDPEFEKDSILWRDVDFKDLMPRICLWGKRSNPGPISDYLLKPSAVLDEKEPQKSFILKSDRTGSVDYLGRIGWPLFHNFNFFMDCDNSIIAFCDSLDTLKKQGYPVDAFVDTPLLLDRGMIEFEAMTPSGSMRCMLDTGCTKSMLNRAVEEGSNDHMIFNHETTANQLESLNPANSDHLVFNFKDVYTVPVFKIGSKDFGSVRFRKIKTPLEIDAIIGMDFLKYTLVFIDFPNRKIYFYEK